MSNDKLTLKAVMRIRCPGGCGKTVAVIRTSGRISVHNDPRRITSPRLCPAAGTYWSPAR